MPIGANVLRDADIPIETIRLSDLTGPLVSLNLKARFMVFDAAYQLPFKVTGTPLAGGFNLQEATPGSLIAYNAAPGTVAPVGKGNYGVFAQSLAAELRDGGLTPDEIFDRVRLRVNEETKGSEIPWDVSKIDADFRFFVRKPDAPPPAASAEQVAALTTKPIGELPVKQAYNAAVARDSFGSVRELRDELRQGSVGQARQGAARRSAGGVDLAPHHRNGHSAGLLVVSGALPTRAARDGRPAAPRRAHGTAGATGRFPGDRL